MDCFLSHDLLLPNISHKFTDKFLSNSTGRQINQHRQKHNLLDGGNNETACATCPKSQTLKHNTQHRPREVKKLQHVNTYSKLHSYLRRQREQQYTICVAASGECRKIKKKQIIQMTFN